MIRLSSIIVVIVCVGIVSCDRQGHPGCRGRAMHYSRQNMEVTVRQRQTLADIAIQVYGDLRAVSDIAYANSISMTDGLVPGTVLECPDVVYDRYLQDYVAENRVSPATARSGKDDMDLGIFTDEFTEEYE